MFCASCWTDEDDHDNENNDQHHPKNSLWWTPITNKSLDNTMAKTKSSSSQQTPSSIHSNLPREFSKQNRHHYDVFDKYQVMSVLGQGSMGAVSKVRIKDNAIGGSAFSVRRKIGFFGKIPFLRKTLGTKKTHHHHHVAKQKPSSTANQNATNESFEYALKSIILDRVSSTFLMELQNEIKILRTLDHPNIVKLHEVYAYDQNIYMVLELCDGGDLYTQSPYSERRAAQLTCQLLSAMRYMHDHGVVHRDLKYENIMFETKSETAQLKVIDFGLSKKFLGAPKYMTERVGTIYTMAPQVLQGIYSSQADLWSIGVIAYMLISATKPFYDKRRRKMIDKIMRADFSVNGPTWANVSDSAKDFVRHLLVVDPKQRMTAEAALHHEWIVKRETLDNEIPSADILAKVDDSLLNYTKTSALKKLALNVIAHRSTSAEILELRKAFDKFDTQRNGVITFAEFKEALEKCNYSEKTLQEIFASVDTNQNGHINYTEFLAATIEAHGFIAEEKIAEAFDRLDCDDTGYISKENLRQILGKECCKEHIDEILASGDVNKDGKISYQEFLQVFRSQNYQIAADAGDDGSSMHSDKGLVGLDAKIPGGKYDKSYNANQP